MKPTDKNSYQKFESERLILRPIQSEDAPFLFTLMNTPKFLKYIGDRKILNEGDARAYILNKLTPVFQRYGFGTYVMLKKDVNQAIGTCGFYDREGIEGLDIGYALMPAHERQGYTFEAVELLLQKGRDTFQLPCISAVTDPDNTASKALLLKSGFRQIGRIQVPGFIEESDFFEIKFK